MLRPFVAVSDAFVACLNWQPVVPAEHATCPVDENESAPLCACVTTPPVARSPPAVRNDAGRLIGPALPSRCCAVTASDAMASTSAASRQSGAGTVASGSGTVVVQAASARRRARRGRIRSVSRVTIR